MKHQQIIVCVTSVCVCGFNFVKSLFDSIFLCFFVVAVELTILYA